MTQKEGQAGGQEELPRKSSVNSIVKPNFVIDATGLKDHYNSTSN